MKQSRAMSLVETRHPNPVHVFRRGNSLDRGPIVEPRFLTALSNEESRPFQDGQRRLGLAQAIIDPNNPLTRRVLVNWVWQRHFGVGLVRTPDDFGIRGEPPTHPELLDYLAETFATVDNWSIKRLHRRILLTQVYQQASIENSDARLKDPQNRLLWRMPRRRLEAEAMRDAMLAVAGRIDLSMGGRPLDLFAEPFTSRRSVYGFINRDVIASFFSAFDMADPSVCAAKRPSTTVPQQTLFALNSRFIQEQAKHLSNRNDVISTPDKSERIRQLFCHAFSRMPSKEEIADALQFIETASQDSASDATEQAWQSLAHALMASNEFIFVD